MPFIAISKRERPQHCGGSAACASKTQAARKCYCSLTPMSWTAWLARAFSRSRLFMRGPLEMKKPPKRDPVGAFARKATATRRMGKDMQCACGEVRPEALITRSKPTKCAECKRKSRTVKTMDDHNDAMTA